MDDVFYEDAFVFGRGGGDLGGDGVENGGVSCVGEAGFKPGRFVGIKAGGKAFRPVVKGVTEGLVDTGEKVGAGHKYLEGSM